MVRAVAWLYHHMGHFPGSLVLPALIVVSVTGIFLASAHAIVGTRNIIGTITPPLSMALAFMIYTTIVLRRTNRER